ncbi:amidohydrolase family protein [Rathayibacter soli]|uniref:amidohydrolase family protein n=1 Tax=Rathayibacter soli TaxID=3144168 RepID=UPI0027E55294|nr:amidohydrolase family protein [Glaciibacter superstes]
MIADLNRMPEPDAARRVELARLADLRLRDYLPYSRLRATQTRVERSAVPCIDAHNHLGTWLSDDGSWLAPDVDALIELMRQRNVRHIVNLDGRWGEELDANLRRYDDRYPDLFSTFAQADFRLLGLPATQVGTALVTQLRQSAARGAKGLKVWKNLGLTERDEHGDLVLPDSALVQPLFEAAGELGLPVTMHTADPIAFFDPMDARNERLENLLQSPDWWFGAPGLPGFDRLIDAFEAVVAGHPGTTFIGAHVGNAAEDLSRVSRMLDSYPNYHVDLGGRMPELGRQPRATRALILRHPDRVLFGTDAFPVSSEDYAVWFRFLETADESFPYEAGNPAAGAVVEHADGPANPPVVSVPSMGRWDVSALDLPVSALPGLYAENAARILGLP